MTIKKDQQRLIRAQAKAKGIPYTKARVELLGPDTPGPSPKREGLDSLQEAQPFAPPGAPSVPAAVPEVLARRTPSAKAFEAELSTIRLKTTIAFKKLRERGFLCRMNFGSTRSEACGDLLEQADAKKGKIRAIAYWHSQDEEGFRQWGKLHIRFAGVGDYDTREAGAMVVEALYESGIGKDWIQWNGDPGETICIVSPEGPRDTPATSRLLTKLMPARKALAELERDPTAESAWLIPVTREALKVIEAYENYSYGGKAMFENLLNTFLKASRNLGKKRTRKGSTSQ